MLNDLVNRRQVFFVSSFLTLFSTLLLSVIVACSSGGEERTVVVGTVTNVVTASVTSVSEFEIVDEHGVTWKFGARGFLGVTPSHLEEHAATGEPVRVEYFEENGSLVAIKVSDG